MAAPNCTKDLMFQIAKDVLDDSQYTLFSQKGQIDFAYDYESTNSDDDDEVVRRFRVNLFMAMNKFTRKRRTTSSSSSELVDS